MNCDRCCEDRCFCRSCPEKCYTDDEPMEAKEPPPVAKEPTAEAKEPTPLNRFTHGFHQWVSRTRLPDLLAQVAKTFQRVKKV